MAIIHSKICDVGLHRSVNQDSTLIYEDVKSGLHIYVVADGMGGHADGEYASNAITEGIRNWGVSFNEETYGRDLNKIAAALRLHICSISNEIYEKYRNIGVCGATCMVLLIYGGKYAVLSAGDSHIYYKNGRGIKPLTIDDTWENQADVQLKFSRSQRRKHANYGKLNNAVGAKGDVHFSIVTNALLEGDTFLLCSDGLYKYCNLEKINREMKKACSKSIEGCTARLLECVYKNGAGDNISIILVKNEGK